MTDYFDRVAGEWDKSPVKRQRSQAVAERIASLTLPHTRSVVDFGAGTGLLGIQLRQIFSEVVLADASASMLAEAQKKIRAHELGNVRTVSLSDLSELKKNHSAIVTLMTLHHIDDVQSFFTAAYHRLEDSGILAIADLYQEDGSFHQHRPSFQGHHGFDVEALSVQAKDCGFDVLSVEPIFTMEKENQSGQRKSYPLFLLLAQKQA